MSNTYVFISRRSAYNTGSYILRVPAEIKTKQAIVSRQPLTSEGVYNHRFTIGTDCWLTFEEAKASLMCRVQFELDANALKRKRIESHLRLLQDQQQADEIKEAK